MQRFRWFIALVCALALIGSGCSDDDDTPSDDTTTTAASGDTTTTAADDTTTTAAGSAEAATLDLTAADFSYDSGGVTEVPAGNVVVTLSNEGEVEHQATIVSFKDGKSIADLQAMGEDLSQLDETVDTYGGPNGAAPGASVVTTVNLAAGSYIVMCFIPDQTDGQPHAAKGQVMPLEVTESAEAATALPEAPETITLDDFEFGVPDGFTGSGSFAIENVGEQMHELSIYRAIEGQTADEAAAILTFDPTSGGPAPEPPYPEAAGAIASMGSGLTNVAELDLTPGEYVFICFLPEADTGAPHFTEGMVRSVTIE